MVPPQSAPLGAMTNGLSSVLGGSISQLQQVNTTTNSAAANNTTVNNNNNSSKHILQVGIVLYLTLLWAADQGIRK